MEDDEATLQTLPTLPPQLINYSRLDYHRLQLLLHSETKPRLTAFILLSIACISSIKPAHSYLIASVFTMVLVFCSLGITVSIIDITNPNPSSHSVSPAPILCYSITSQRKTLAKQLSMAAAANFILLLCIIFFFFLCCCADYVKLPYIGMKHFPANIIILASIVIALVFSTKLLLNLWWSSFRDDPYLWRAISKYTLFGSVCCRVSWIAGSTIEPNKLAMSSSAHL